MVKPESYAAVAASQTAAVVGPARVGVLMQRLVVTVVTAATSTVTLIDGNVSIVLMAANTAIGVYVIDLGIRCYVGTTPGWKITTGAGATVVAIGKFGGE